MSKYIDIREAGTSPSGVTRVWEVKNTRTGEIIGRVKWYGGFRKYAFFPEIEGVDWILFDAACLKKIAEFLDEKNGDWLLAKRNGKRDRREGKDQDA